MTIVTEGKTDPDSKYIVSPLTDLRNIDIFDETPLLLVRDQKFDPSYSFVAGCELIQDEIITKYIKPHPSKPVEFPIYGIFRGFYEGRTSDSISSNLTRVAVGRNNDKTAQYHITLSDALQFKEAYANNFPNILRVPHSKEPHSEIAFASGDFFIGKENIQEALREIPGREVYADLLEIVEGSHSLVLQKLF